METALPLVPEHAGLAGLRAAARSCCACDLCERGTQTVFGEGPTPAAVMLVGEQPGDAEDVAGRPFVGPAGRLLDRALEDAGVDRRICYVTNMVKHFKWVPRGKKRLHQKPNAREIGACRPWLDAELSVVRPQVVVCMGATAAQGLLGRSFRVTKERGRILKVDFAPAALATVHPSSILRAPDDDARHEAYAGLVADLRVVAREIA